LAGSFSWQFTVGSLQLILTANWLLPTAYFLSGRPGGLSIHTPAGIKRGPRHEAHPRPVSISIPGAASVFISQHLVMARNEAISALANQFASVSDLVYCPSSVGDPINVATLVVIISYFYSR